MSLEMFPDDEDGVHFPDLKIIDDGQVWLPKQRRQLRGIESGTLVDLKVIIEDGNKFMVRDRKVWSNGKITIPSRQRDVHEIEKGDIIDILVYRAKSPDGIENDSGENAQ
jgi:bifunctional DNA-binding transcriptional regulator/antitoxin component of YhaV-PrlF toxin-antitoxin module